MQTVSLDKYNGQLSVSFYIDGNLKKIGQNMEKINENAYMNGYNWEAFFNYYLMKNAPDILIGMSTDPEAGMYAAYFDLTPENEIRATKFMEIIQTLFKNEDELYSIVRENGEEIEWD